MSKRYVCTAEYITVSTADPATGTRVKLGFYRGALLPHDMTEEEIEHHLGTKQIEAVELSDQGTITGYEDERLTNPAEVTDGLGEPNKMPETPPSDDDGEDEDEDGEPEVVAGDDVPEPKRNADRPAWVDYAVSKGADRDEIEENEVSRADLIAVWGTPR